MAIATNGSCRLHHDTFGDPERPTLLMINGLGSQCTNYQDEWCRGFAERLRIWGSPEFADEDRWRTDAERAFDRSFTPDGTGRQFMAVGASGSRAEGLRTVTAHAAEADRM
jgi:pimeloyl-ACP methyl ester carboxylesterase